MEKRDNILKLDNKTIEKKIEQESKEKLFSFEGINEFDKEFETNDLGSVNQKLWDDTFSDAEKEVSFNLEEIKKEETEEFSDEIKEIVLENPMMQQMSSQANSETEVLEKAKQDKKTLTENDKKVLSNLNKEPAKAEQIRNESKTKAPDSDNENNQVTEDKSKFLMENPSWKKLIDSCNVILSDKDSAGVLFESVKKSTQEFVDEITLKKEGEEKAILNKFNSMLYLVSEYYELNKGSKWSKKGKRRRDITGKLVNDMKEIRKELSVSFEANSELDLVYKKSSRLVGDEKMFGDSKEMASVKTAILSLQSELGQEVDKNNLALTFDKLEKAYGTAIAECQKYILTKKSSTQRYAMVHDRMLDYMAELGMLSTLKNKMNNGQKANMGTISNGFGLLFAARFDNYETKRAKKKNVKKPVPAKALEKVKDYDPKAFDDLKNLDSAADTILKLMKMDKTPVEFAKKLGDDSSNLIIYLYDLLKNMPQGEHTEIFHTAIAGYMGKDKRRTYTNSKGDKVNCDTLIRIRQDVAGTLYISINGTERQLPYTREAVLNGMQTNMVMHEKVFGDTARNDAIEKIKKMNAKADNGEIRDICVKVMRNLLGKDAPFFHNLKTEDLRILTINLAEKRMDAKTIQEYMKFIDKSGEKNAISSHLINGTGTMELLKNREEKKDTTLKKAVIVEKKKESTESKKPSKSDTWPAEQEQLKNFMADIIYSKDTWITDTVEKKEGGNLEKVLYRNIIAINALLKNPQMLKDVKDSLLASMGIEADKEMNDNFDTILENVKEVSTMIAEKVPEFAKGKFFEDITRGTIIAGALAMPETKKAIKEAEKAINEAVEGICSQMQKVINDNLSKIIKPAEPEKEEEEKPALTKEEITKRGNKQLEKIVNSVMEGQKGQGKFLKLVMENYFEGVSTLDKRSMVAWALRNAKYVNTKGDNNTTLTVSEEKQKECAGAFLGGMFKGAGPLFQKMLQGLPVKDMPEGIKDAFVDVKSNLLPIPDEIVEAELLAMVERSKGAVTSIKKTKSLGAASVGQAFLCTIYGPSLGENGQEVVVKLLRPEARNRMEREKAIMLKCAKNTDENEGMLKTYQGQLLRIEEELDLTIEARNVERGQIYDKTLNKDKTPDAVKSMKLSKLISPTTTSMVVEKAPGQTVDKYIGELSDRQKYLMEPLYRYEVKNGEKVLIKEKDGNPKIFDDNEKQFDTRKKISEMKALLNQARKRQKYLTRLAEKWVEEGLYGEGFYHGDLHAGNIMISDEQCTVIDFGNATQLDEKQKKDITCMMAATSVGDAVVFREGFHNLMIKTEESERYYEQVKDQFTAELNTILNLGDVNSVGQRIIAALIKAQEMGLELPAAIANFASCQQRINNTIAALNHEIDKLYKSVNVLLKIKDGYDKKHKYFNDADMIKGLKAVDENNFNKAKQCMIETCLMSNQNLFLSYLRGNKQEKFFEVYNDYLCAEEQRKKTILEGYETFCKDSIEKNLPAENMMGILFLNFRFDLNTVTESERNTLLCVGQSMTQELFEKGLKILEKALTGDSSLEMRAKNYFAQLEKDENYDKDLKIAVKMYEEVEDTIKASYKSSGGAWGSLTGNSINEFIELDREKITAKEAFISMYSEIAENDKYKEEFREKVDKVWAVRDEIIKANPNLETEDINLKFGNEHRALIDDLTNFITEATITELKAMEKPEKTEYGDLNVDDESLDEFNDVMGSVICKHKKETLMRAGIILALKNIKYMI